MGVATTRSMERVAAAVGALEGAETRFERADDVAHGGVLCALAALLTFGLLRHAQSHFSSPKGFYPMESIFLLLAYLALGRVPSLEQLRYHSPGEWGKLLGLDRIPEVKTLRAKISVLGDDEERTARWSGDLAKDWMAHDVKAAGVLLIDGHVRVYHGRVNLIHDATLEALCTELNSTEISYPSTTLRLVYRPIRSSIFPPGQDV